MMSSILLVNDDPVQLHLLSSLLEQDDFEVNRFVSSEEAWRVLQAGYVPDAIVLDLHMPQISGWRFCELIHSHFGREKAVPPILAVSATYTGIDAQEVLKGLGASAFLSLPVEPQHFRQQVRHLVENPPRPQVPYIWMVSSNESEILRIREIVAERGWHMNAYQKGGQVQSASIRLSPDIVIIEDPLPDMGSEDLATWCKVQFPQIICVILKSNEESTPYTEAISVDKYMPKGCDPVAIISLCDHKRWERALSRVEHVLNVRTDDLRESEAQFKMLFETLPDVLVIYDYQNIIRHINTVGARQLDFSPEELIGAPFSLIRGEFSDASSMVMERPARHELLRWQESHLRKKNGTELPVEMMERVVRFQGQCQTLVIARDLTLRKQMEQEKSALEHQLQQAQKMEAIGRLASGIAHDMNNMLTAVLAHAALIKVQTDAGKPIWEAGDVIEKAVHRGKELTAQLLGFARQGKHHHTTINIHDIIQEMLGLLEKTVKKTLHFKLALAAAEPHVIGDPNQLYQVFMNLAVNACDAMGENGELLVQTVNESVTPEQASHVPGLYAGEYLLIRVTDSGTGIPPDIQGQIFEPFFTTKELGQGTGMGLAMVYGIVKNHRGYIGVTSMLGGGTTMRVYLPSAPSEAHRLQMVPAKELVRGRGHILVVDDEKEVAEAAQAILEYLGYQVTVVLTGKEAIDFCQDLHQPVDVVLLDMIMTDMSGAECFGKLRTIRPNIQVILCTGYDRNHAVQNLFNHGVAGFIQKPYDLEDLAQICTVVLQEGDQVEICGKSPS